MTGFIQSSLNFFISNVLQESIHKRDVLASFCSDYSPTSFALHRLNRAKGETVYGNLITLYYQIKNYNTIFLNEENKFD